MNMSQTPISSLAQEYMQNDMHKHMKHADECVGYGWWFYLFWFLVVGIIVWFLLFALKPDFVQKTNKYDEPTGEVDQGRVLGISIVVALIVTFLIWMFQWGYGNAY